MWRREDLQKRSVREYWTALERRDGKGREGGSEGRKEANKGKEGFRTGQIPASLNVALLIGTSLIVVH